MSKLTRERLEEIKGSVFALKAITEYEQIQMIDELLARRRSDVGIMVANQHAETLKQFAEKDAQIAALIAERDNYKSRAECCSKNYQALDEKHLAELTSLKSAPGVEEVEACIFTPEPYHRGVTTIYGETKYDGKKLADIARRLVVSQEEEKKRADACSTNMFQAEQERDEVVNLLKFIDANIDNFMPLVRQLAELSTDGAIKQSCSRILEIVERQ